METVKWLLRLIIWPAMLSWRLKKDHGEHQVVLPVIAVVFGLVLFFGGIKSLFFHDTYIRNTHDMMAAVIIVIIYLLVGLWLYFENQNPKEPRWQRRGSW